jgi:hypothetical protein
LALGADACRKERIMRGGKIARLLFGAGLAIALCHSAVQAAGKIQVAQTSTVTNCMMACNSQAATCQTTCLVPGTPPTGAATAGGNANQSAACQLNCTTQQINCQTTCARASPSQ